MHSLDLDVPQLHKKKAFPFFISFSSVKGGPPGGGEGEKEGENQRK